MEYSSLSLSWMSPSKTNDAYPFGTAHNKSGLHRAALFVCPNASEPNQSRMAPVVFSFSRSSFVTTGLA